MKLNPFNGLLQFLPQPVTQISPVPEDTQEEEEENMLDILDTF